MLAGLVGGVIEHRDQLEVRARVVDARERMDAVAASASIGGERAAVARKIRLLCLQLQQEDFSDRLLENPTFQLLGALGRALMAASLLAEAQAKWPRRANDRAEPLA